MAEYYTTYLLKGKYIEKEVLSGHILSYMNAAQNGFQFADFLCFTSSVIKKNKVKLVLIIVDTSFSPVNFAGLEEIVQQMEKMQHYGITVYLYAPSYNMSTLYLAASADKTFIHPIGNICFGGFYKNHFSAAPLLKKLGIKFETIKTGALKDTFASLGDDVEESDFPKRLLQDYEQLFVQQIEKKSCGKELYKKLLKEKVFSAKETIDIGFLDEAVTLTELFHKIMEEGFALKKVKASLKNRKGFWKKKVAIVFINGEIIDGMGVSFLNGTKKTVSSGRIIGIINCLERKKSVEAVLFRIDSTGGSSSAGYDLYKAIKKLSEKKLTVVSIGNYVTSAAYWMALGGDTIFSNASSVIGAVGAVTTRPYFLDAMEKVGISVMTEKLENTETINFFEEYSESTKVRMEKWLDEILLHFVDAVKTHCKLDEETLNIISSGCSFSGKYAWKQGLVDQLGGIDQALNYIQTKLGDIAVEYWYYPENKVPMLYKKLFGLNAK